MVYLCLLFTFQYNITKQEQTCELNQKDLNLFLLCQIVKLDCLCLCNGNNSITQSTNLYQLDQIIRSDQQCLSLSKFQFTQHMWLTCYKKTFYSKSETHTLILKEEWTSCNTVLLAPYCANAPRSQVTVKLSTRTSCQRIKATSQGSNVLWCHI